MSCLCIRPFTAFSLTQSKILSLYHDLLFVPHYCFDLLSHHSPPCHSSLAGPLVSQSCQAHSHLRVSVLAVPLPWVFFPQVFCMGWSLLPSSVCSHMRGFLYSKTAITFKFLHNYIRPICSMSPTIKWKPHTSVVFSAVFPALRIVLLVLNKDLLNNQIHIHFTSAWNQFD